MFFGAVCAFFAGCHHQLQKAITSRALKITTRFSTLMPHCHPCALPSTPNSDPDEKFWIKKYFNAGAVEGGSVVGGAVLKNLERLEYFIKTPLY